MVLQGIVYFDESIQNQIAFEGKYDNRLIGTNATVVESGFKENSFYSFILGIQKKELSEPESLSNMALKLSGSFYTRLKDLDESGVPLSVGAWINEERLTTFLARDAFSSVPLYYLHIPGKFAYFSTNLSSIVTSDLVRKKYLDLDIFRILAHLDLRREHILSQSSGTFYSHIKSVPPGHIVELSPTSVKVQRYVSFDPFKWKSLKTNGEVNEALFRVFRQSVERCSLDNGGQPFASHLSGGLDSSSVSAMLRFINPHATIHTLHNKSKYPDSDETAYAQAVVEKICSIHHEVFQSEEDLRLIRLQTSLSAQPLASRLSPALLSTMLLYAKNLGSKVLLNGSGGDSVIGSGMEVFQHAFETKNWALLKELLAKRVPYFSSTIYEGWESFSYEKRHFLVEQFYYYNRLRRVSRSPLTLTRTYFELARNLNLSHGFVLKRGFASLLNRRNKPNVNGQMTLGKDELLELSDPTSKFSISRSLLGDLNPAQFAGLFDDVFNPTLSWAAENQFDLDNYYGISSRSPMKNKVLLELCMSIPDLIKYGDGRGREHFRAAMKDLLPQEVYNRASKATLSSQYGQDMTSRLWNQAKESVMDSQLLWDFIDRKKLLHEVGILNNPNVSYDHKTKTWVHITRVVTLSSWLDWLSGNK
ncbi:MAG: hypothetical protein J7619_22510 [Dyadobacter sp.]|uniref:asparagine synthase-related protein n=1 Tax=Dyadobacter sp. TaxID=1914288 RepID=UPI001B17AB56|nr:asparagine synthetase B family protein [Dyadobacter sp.]MBO9615490.1 hypothetical protein [Dyadobacter sp.]